MHNDNQDPYDLIPEHMRPGMRLYIERGVMPGGFLTSILCNDLSGAVVRADWINRRRIPDFVDFLNWHAPGTCWGSKERVLAWHKAGGLAGQKTSPTELTCEV